MLHLLGDAPGFDEESFPGLEIQLLGKPQDRAVLRKAGDIPARSANWLREMFRRCIHSWSKLMKPSGAACFGIRCMGSVYRGRCRRVNIDGWAMVMVV